MDLLPKNHKQFQDQSYWTKFFADGQTKQGFEWYATYEELEYYLKQTIKGNKEQMKVLTLGCGNSLLSEKLWKGLELAQPVTAIDFEESVIKKMKNRGPRGVEYEVMDATDMTFDACEFDYAIDKGTLDALCADRSPETAEKVVKYLNEVCRVLYSKGGTYVCVSLLQDFVLDALVSFFNKGLGNEAAGENIFDFRI
jgi:ubiquinone/menaquinone biosynthesis C-methylase UbiE